MEKLYYLLVSPVGFFVIGVVWILLHPIIDPEYDPNAL